MIKLNVKILRLGYKNKICKSKTTQKSLLKLPMLSALQEKEFLLLINPRPQSKRSLRESDLRTQLKIEEDIEKCYLLLQELNNIFQESYSKKKLPSNQTLKESTLLNMLEAKESWLELKLIKVWESYLTENKRTSQKVLKPYQLWLLSSINWVADSPSGEQF
jgi:hypothetical protein